MAISRKEISLLLLAFAVLLFSMVFLLSAPEAQTGGGAGPPAGTPVTDENPDNAASPPNLFRIPAESCTVADTGASVTFQESDGTQGRVVDGQDVEITATTSEIRVELPEEVIAFGDVAEFPDNDTAFDTGNDITVVASTGITCAGGGGTAAREQTAAQNQSNQPAQSSRDRQKNKVVPKTTPRRPLPPTGGPPVSVVVAGFVLAGAGLLGACLVVRRGRRR